ncbi:MAG: DUF2723 domain-containing protein [Chloroflexi bacterium]|nr:DUF2723 domain-containing protein [Chloroflexota bacterium]
MRAERFWLAIFGAAMLLPFTVYLVSLAPDLTWAHNGADGGDLIVAAYTLGVPHPPGYPAYTLLAHLFTWIPLGSIAYRVNLFSAVSAALAVGVLALLTAQTCQVSANLTGLGAGTRRFNLDGELAALAAAWGFAFIPLVWEQAIIAEVYAPFALMIALVLWLASRVASSRGAFALGLAWGLALGFHLTALFLFPLVWWSVRRKHALLLACVAGASLASAQWFYPVWRAGRGAITWGDPTTLQGWWWLVSGALYREYVFAAPFDVWLGRIAFLVNALLFGLGPLLSACALIGWREIAHVERGKVIAYGATMLAYVVFAIGYDSADSISLAIPAVMIFCVGIGAGVVALLDALRARFGNRVVMAGWIGLLIQVTFVLALNWRAVSLADDRAAMQCGERVLSQLPPASVVVTQDDRATFALWYFRYVLGQRADALIVDYDLLAFEWYRAQVGITPAQLERASACWIENCCVDERVRCATRE